MPLLLLLWPLAATLVATAQGLDSTSMDLLFSKIFDSRFAMVNPPRVNDTFNVTFDLAIAQLLGVEEKDQTIALQTWRRMTWYDTRLAWKGRVFDGNLTFNTIGSIKIPNSQIWKPDLVVYNDVRRTELDWSFYFATIHSNGLVRLNTPQLMTMSCAMNVEYFPYDRQVCTMKVGSWTMDGVELNLLNISTRADLSSLEEDNEYCVVGAPLTRHSIKYACCDAPYIDISYRIILQRKPLYYELNLIMPCIAILIVALFGFRLPPESGERISLCVTVLLALSVFLQLASEHTPTQSDVVPLISRYFMAAIGMSSMCVLGSILVLLLHFNGKQARPMGSRTEICFRLLCRLVCYPGFEDSPAFCGRSGVSGGRRRPAGGLAEKHWATTTAAGTAAAERRHMEVEEIDVDAFRSAAAPVANGNSGGNRRPPQQPPPPPPTSKPPPAPSLTLTLPAEATEALDRMDAALADVRMSLARTRDSGRRERRWEDAAQATDRLLFLISVAGFIALSVSVFAIRPPEAVNAATDCKAMRAAYMA